MLIWYKEVNSIWAKRRLIRIVINYFSPIVNLLFPKGIICTKSFTFTEGAKSSLIYGIFVFKDDNWKDNASYYYDHIIIKFKHNGWNELHLEETIEHEIRHAMQFLNKETGKFDENPNRGLPKKKLRTKHARFDGFLNKNNKDYKYYIAKYKENPWTYDDRLPHYMRDVEFQTNLGTIWFEIKKELEKIKDHNVRYRLFYKFLNLKLKNEEFVHKLFMSIWNGGGIYYSPVLLARIKEDPKKWKDYIKKLCKLYQKEFSNKIKKVGTLTDW